MCPKTMRPTLHQRHGDPVLRAARADGFGRPPKGHGRQEAHTAHEEECRRQRGGPWPTGRHQAGRHGTQEDSQRHLARPMIPALPERDGAEAIGMLRRHAGDERRQGRVGGRRKGEASRKEPAEQRVSPAQVFGADAYEICPSLGQVVGLR